MRATVLLSLFLASLYEVSALESTSPFLAWSPQEFSPRRLDTQVISVQDLHEGLNDLADCSHKAVLFIDEPQLHADDLGRGGRSKLKNQVQSAESSLQIPFVDGAVDMENLAEKLSQKCHATLVHADSESAGVLSTVDGPSVIYKKLTAGSADEKDEAVEELIAEIRKTYKNDYLVLYSSSQTKEIPTTHQYGARQIPEEPTPTKKPSGVFHHYTFFSQGIFMGLLIAVVVVPIAVMGVFWNLSVQQPQRFEKKQN
ncbi:hypothetical protein BGX29_011960 [Mortierella sp. GBA35]|nr:hypothetical protein BGX23_008675 [Mortierella sp. AD031]KAF9105575.1 hypothetical protein BGX29_011960 [Mortierella sp. GBA35]KAG0214419.1 hypothetical protein BGX33_002203 [Mortierella sp. NVP41]